MSTIKAFWPVRKCVRGFKAVKFVYKISVENTFVKLKRRINFVCYNFCFAGAPDDTMYYGLNDARQS